jgi:hypothetical protein
MSKQLINIGTVANDGTGSSLRDGGDLINDNFNEIYSAIGDGTTIQFDISGATNGQTLVYNSSTSKFEAGAAGSFTVAGDSGSESIGSGDTLNVLGGTGIDTSVTATDNLTISVDNTIVSLTGTQTLTNKTLTSPQINEAVAMTATSTELNLLSGVTALVTADSSTVFTNKTFDADGTGNSITNIEDANIKSGAAIDATKIHDGSVSNTEFGYLNGVTSNIQDQINAAGLAFAIALGGE